MMGLKELWIEGKIIEMVYCLWEYVLILSLILFLSIVGICRVLFCYVFFGIFIYVIFCLIIELEIIWMVIFIKFFNRNWFNYLVMCINVDKNDICLFGYIWVVFVVWGVK